MLKGPLRSLQWIFHTFHVMVIQGKLGKGRAGKGFHKPPRASRLHQNTIGYNGGIGMDRLLLLGKIQAILDGLTDRELRMLYNRLLTAKNGRIT